MRFLFGMPFALCCLALLCFGAGAPPPRPSATGHFLTAFACLAQVAATGLMLLAMRERPFVVAIALTKTEAIQITLFNRAVSPAGADPASLSVLRR